MFRNQYNWIVLVSLGLCCCRATATLVEKPQNTFASEGHRVQLNCSTSDLTTPISWQYIPGAEGDLPKDVFLGGRLVNDYVRFQMYGNSAEGVYNLVIPSVELRNAGTYRCRDQDGAGEHVDAILNVTKDLHIAPEHAEAQVGERIQMICKTYYKTEPVNWQHIPFGKAIPVDVYIGGKIVIGYASRYEAQMDSTTGTSNLIITAVKLEDSGLYRCIEKDGLGQYKDAELTVMDFDGCLIDHIDSCETSPINVTLECNVIFSGKFAPPIQWVNADGDVVNQGVVTTNQSDSVTSTLVIEIENLNIISDYTCHAALSRASCKPNNSDHCPTKAYASSTESYIREINPSPPEQNWTLLWLLLLIIPLIIVIIVIIVCYCRHRNTNRNIALGTAVELTPMTRQPNNPEQDK